ncbi:MAG TPA: hypothetical protein VNW04_22080 [Puia sp.]|nr:hypothetical protein [Puia sp.]
MRKFILVSTLAVVIILAGLSSCSKQNEAALAAKSTAGQCDTTSVSYVSQIVPILQANCYECHGNGTSAGSGGITLQGYSNLLSWARNGYLVGCVSHAPGFIAMPYLQPALPACEMNTIAAWVHQGANNN